jgi:Fe-S-cluster-containing dehydrogenase component
MPHLRVDEKRCVGCLLCMLECSFHHFEEFAPCRASVELGDRRRGVEANRSTKQRSSLTLRADCHPCVARVPPPCVAVCPRGAIQVVDFEDNE